MKLKFNDITRKISKRKFNLNLLAPNVLAITISIQKLLLERDIVATSISN